MQEEQLQEEVLQEEQQQDEQPTEAEQWKRTFEGKKEKVSEEINAWINVFNK